MVERIPAEVKDKILKSAYNQLETYKAEGKGTDKYSVELAHWLEAQEGVVRATIRGRNTITVDFEDETQVGILLNRQAQYGSGYDLDDMVSVEPLTIASESLAARQLQRDSRLSAYRWSWIPQTPGSTRALLFDPLYDDWPPEATTDDIENALNAAGYTVDKMLGDDADLPHLETVESSKYGAIFIRAHGGVMVVNGDDKTHIMVRPFFDSYPDPALAGYNGIGVVFVGTNWGPKYAYAINEYFVRHHLAATRFPKTVMHLLVCHGGDPAGQDDLIDAFLDFGVGCFTGWTRNASLAHGDPAAVAFFEYLCGAYGRTVAGAIHHIETLGHSPDTSTGAELVAYGNAGLSLLGLRRIVVQLDIEHIELFRKFPHETIELVVELPPEIEIPDWSPVGGKFTAVDRLGQRRFLPSQAHVSIFSSEEEMEEAVRSFAL